MRDPSHRLRGERSVQSRLSRSRAWSHPGDASVSFVSPSLTTRSARDTCEWGTDLPHRVYERLPAEFGDSFVTSTLLEERHSSDGTTTKLLFEMQDGLRVEVRT